MKFRKILSATLALAMSASAVAGLAVTASAEATTDTVAVKATYINTSNPDQNYSTAGVLYANYFKISGGALVSQGGGEDVTLLLVDLSDYKTGTATVTDVKLNLTATCTASGYGSNLQLATTANTDWDYETITWNTNATDLGTVTYNSVIGYGESTGTPFNYDIKSIYEADSDGIISLAIYTATARQQLISNVSVSVTTTTDEQVAYTLNAVNGETDLGVVVSSGEDTVNTEVTATGIPQYVLGNDGKYYVLNDDTVSSYQKSITLGSTAYSGTVNYDATENIVGYADAENFASVEKTTNTAYSNGAYAAISTGKIGTLGTFPAGQYTLTVSFIANGGRGIFIRDVSIADNTKNVIANADIDKYTNEGMVTVTFALDEETTIGISGYTSGSTTNRSADMDYVVLTSLDTPEIVSVTMNTSDELPTLTDLAEVSDETATGATPLKGDKVTTYTIRIGNYAAGVPTLNFGKEIEDGVSSLTPTGDGQLGCVSTYGYAGTDYYVFVIQTLNISEQASSVSFPGASDYTDIVEE